MQQAELVVSNRFGLHMRAAVRVTQIASKFRSRVVLSVNGRKANARSLVAVMVLTASVGARVYVETAGPDEVEALKAVARLFDDRVGEPEGAPGEGGERPGGEVRRG